MTTPETEPYALMTGPFVLPPAPISSPPIERTMLSAAIPCTDGSSLERILSSSWSGVPRAGSAPQREPAVHSALWHACRGIWRPPMR